MLLTKSLTTVGKSMLNNICSTGASSAMSQLTPTGSGYSYPICIFLDINVNIDKNILQNKTCRQVNIAFRLVILIGRV